MGDSHLIETRTSSQEILKGVFLHAFRDTVRLPDGQSSVREYVVHPGAVMVIPLLTDAQGQVRVVLERQFENRRAAHRQAQDATQPTDEPALWRQPGGWLHSFARDMEAALLAELEVRLQPVIGMMEALNNEVGKHP